MKKLTTIYALTALILSASGTAQAVQTSVWYLNGPQDPLVVPELVHELGNKPPFPTPEWITSGGDRWTEYTPCPQYDEPGMLNAALCIFNMTDVSWTDLWYVGDADTWLTNDDGIINGGLAFKIDRVGVNRPLLSESMTPNDIFEPGEIWEFVIQDYVNLSGLPPSLFGSIGIPSFGALGDFVSSGSIIAIPAPGAVVLGSIGLGFLGWLRKRGTL